MTLIHRLRTALAAVLLPSALLSPASMAAQPSLFPPPAACDPTKQSCVPGPTPGPTPPPSCGPGPGGAPCGGGGPASQGNTSGTSQGAGNPLNVINGNKYQQEVDMPALPGVLGLELVRHYNSAWRSLGQSGYGWRLSYETDLFVVRNTVQIRQADGTELIFNRDPNNPSTCHSANPADGRILIKATPRGEEFVWLWANGRRLAFDSRGKLESITAPTGEFVTLQHGPKGELLKVTDPQGRSLSLEWGSPKAPGFQGIVAIQTPLGRFVLHHNGDAKHPGLGNLMAVSAPQGSTRRYHYGADAGEANPSLPHHLTGISLESLDAKGKVASQRLNTWAYDVNGRGILSARGLPRQTGPDGQTQAGTGIEQVNLDFSSPGKTILTNSLGQTTSYRHAIVGNSFRLLEVRGAGCASCGEVNLRYGYDRLGRLTEQTTLNQLGQPLRSTRTDLDGLGRAVRVSSVNYVSSTGAGLAKPQAPQLLVRYEYAGEGMQPTLIARPSVISQPGATSGAGKEHQTRIVYNPAGQPLSVTESGFSPLDEQGQPLNLAGAKAATTEAERASPISRSTAYKYQLINGRSVLAEIDGPLQNGAKGTPEDSDITRFDYDQRANHLQVITQPGKLKSSVTYDAAGRIATVRNAQGFKTSFTLDARSQPTQISSSGPGWAQPQVQSFQYNALGQPTESGHGSPTGQNYQPQLAQGFDAFGRKLWSASALGMLEHNRFDTESRLIETGLHSNRMAQVQRYAYDSLGRLTQASDSSGASITLAYDAQGDLQTATDALGRVRSLASTVPTQAGSTARLAELPHTARQLRDDFGRIVATISPDAGSTTRSFDAADRLIASSDAQGHRAAYAHDVQGRIQRQTILDAGSKQALVTLWQYQGQQLIALEHPTQSERYAYDARGLRVSRIVTLKTANGGEHRAVTRYHHDDSGTLQSASLPDGSQIIYERNGQGQITALKRSALQSAWLRSHASWLAPAQTIVQDLQRDIVGLSRYTAGNGIQASFQRSEQGVLARVLYRNTKRVETATPMQTAASASWPILLGRSTQDTISLLLGVGSAHAAPASQGAGPTQGGAAPVNTASVKLPGALGLAPDPQALIDQRLLWDAQGNLLHKQDRTSANTARDASYASYAYDGQDRLIVATQTPGKRETPAVSVATTGSAMDRPGSHTSRYFYQAGRRLLSQENVADQSDLSAHTRKAAYQRNTHRWLGDSANSQPARYNANGQPNSVGQREYVWDALGRLVQVRQENRDLAQYRYSHRGERIAKTVAGKTTHYLYHEAGQISAELDDQGRITRQYLYLAEQPIAVIDTPEGVLLSNQELSSPTQLAQDAAFILKNLWRSVSGGGAEQWAWLHPNHLGAPE
ncbi:DUF6531 domain-containing protein, partial [Rhodoferax sp.]|uniref:DUF6531 domain-containing protein n=1 Tax=Rhodoferax sp. TaxID=50421 RepID=UPI0027665F2A|nr:DUF6531 domain-containing protein [Rhodoferax sp.]